MKNIFTHHKQPNYPYYDIPNAKCNIVIGSAGMGNTSGYTKPVLYNAKPGISYIATGFLMTEILKVLLTIVPIK